MIELHDLSIGYGDRTLLSEVEATIEKGKLTALIGRNGTGKSTLLRAIAGLNRRYSGRILLDEIRSRYRTLVDKPRMDPIFTLVFVGLANASFCKLFGGDWTAVGIVFTATLVGFAVKQRMQAHAVNHFLVFACSAFVASLCATAALRFDCTAEITLATSPLFLVPGVPLINGVIDIMEGHVLMGVSRLVNAMLLIVCIAVGLSATLLMVKDSLL